jgi:hypothetical protein
MNWERHSEVMKAAYLETAAAIKTGMARSDAALSSILRGNQSEAYAPFSGTNR